MAKVSFTTKDGKKVSFSTKSKQKTKKSTKRKQDIRTTIKKLKKLASNPKRKVNRTKSTRKNVAKKSKKSGGPKGKASFIDKIPLLKNKTVQRVGFGLGMGSIAAIIASRVPVPIVQNNAQLIGTGIAFATDPLSGVVRLALSGGLGQLSNLFGGQQNGLQTNGNNGFA